MASLNDCYLTAPGCEIVRNPRLRTHLSTLKVVRNPNRRLRQPIRADQPDLRARFRSLVTSGRPMRNQVGGCPVVTPHEAEELLGLNAIAIERGMSTGRYCITTITDADGSKRTGVRISELVGHPVLGSR
jgi:hypothetical protein